MSGIVLGCFEVPGWGGLTTATYRLFETMLEEGIDVHYLNLIREADVEVFRQRFGPAYDNPRGLPHVLTCRLRAPLHEPQAGLAALLAEVDPASMAGMGDIATYLMKRAARGVPVVFVTGGCMQVDPAAPFTEQGLPPYGPGSGPDAPSVAPDWKEREAAGMADRIVTHSEMIRELYRHFYPRDGHKIHPRVVWFAEWIHADALRHAAHARPFAARDVDALFVASSWTRVEKNVGMVAEIAARLPDARIHVVGEAPERIPGVTHHGIVSTRDALFRLMGRARTVVCPSLFDAAPGILFEASAMGCNVVASRNCGNWALCHEDLLVDPYTADGFAERIRRAREREYPDRMESFLRSGSYREIVRVLEESGATDDPAPERSAVSLAPAAARIVTDQVL